MRFEWGLLWLGGYKGEGDEETAGVEREELVGAEGVAENSKEGRRES